MHAQAQTRNPKGASAWRIDVSMPGDEAMKKREGFDQELENKRGGKRTYGSTKEHWHHHGGLGA